MVFYLAVKSAKKICYELNLRELKKGVGEDGVTILAVADCDFHSNKVTSLTHRKTLLSTGKKLATDLLGKQKRTFVAFKDETGEVYFMIVHKYNSRAEIDGDFLNSEDTKIDREFRSKRGTSVLKASELNVSSTRDGGTFIFTPKSKNGVLITNELTVTPIINPTIHSSEENYSHCIEFLKGWIASAASS